MRRRIFPPICAIGMNSPKDLKPFVEKLARGFELELISRLAALPKPQGPDYLTN